jgi:hypothetical protein
MFNKLMFAVLVLFMPGHAWAGEAEDRRLHGLLEMGLAVNDSRDDGGKCGLTEQVLRAAAMFPLSAARIEIVPDSLTDFTVSVVTIYHREVDLCVSNVRVGLHSVQAVTLYFSGKATVIEKVPLWPSYDMLLSSPRMQHRARVVEAIEEATKAFVTDWNLANRTTLPQPPRSVVDGLFARR